MNILGRESNEGDSVIQGRWRVNVQNRGIEGGYRAERPERL